MSDSTTPAEFVETLEYRRFAEFCDACRQYRYIGLCYGPPGVGKTLSARRYALWDLLEKVDPLRIENEVLTDLLSISPPHTVFYTPSVLNTPRGLIEEIRRTRTRLHRLTREPLKRQHQAEFEACRREFDAQRPDSFPSSIACMTSLPVKALCRRNRLLPNSPKSSHAV